MAINQLDAALRQLSPTTGDIAAKPQSVGTREEAARTRAEEFEAVFISVMLSQMTSGLKAEAPFGGGHAEETWRGFLFEQYANKLAENGGIGLSDAIYRELIAAQETKP